MTRTSALIATARSTAALDSIEHKFASYSMSEKNRQRHLSQIQARRATLAPAAPASKAKAPAKPRVRKAKAPVAES